MRKMDPEKKDAIMDFLLPASAVAGAIVFWSLSVHLFEIPYYLLPPPEVVAYELYNRWDMLYPNAIVTLNEVFVGFFASIIIAVPLSMVIVSYRLAERIMLPLLVMSQSIPKVAIAPLFVVWMGFGLLPKVAVTFLIAFFPILIATISGLKSVETDMLDLVKSMGGSATQLMMKVRVPNSLPQVFSGLKISICLSVVGAIVGEFVGSDQGLGFLILTSSGDLDGELLYSTLVILILVGVTLFGIVGYLEKVALPWHVSQRTQEESLWQS
jgi:NitT/TauT family transport system permease protein